jgi:hypothetical protein
MNIITTNRFVAKRRPLLATATGCSLGLASLLLAACGGGAANTSTASSAAHASSGGATAAVQSTKHKAKGKHKSGKTVAASNPQAEAVEFAQCMRAHGVPGFPDDAITITARGAIQVRLTRGSGVNPQSPQFQSAFDTCRSHLPKSAQGTRPSAQEVSQMLKYSNCMRSHGVTNFPEPNSNGQMMVKAGSGPGAINPNTPTYQAAAKACRSLEPAGFSTP